MALNAQKGMIDVDGQQEALVVPVFGGGERQRYARNIARGEDDLCALLGGPSVGKAVDVHRQHRNVIAQILNPRCGVSPVLVHAPNAAMVNVDLG